MENLPALQEKAISLRDYLNRDNIKDALQSALPKWLSVDRLLRIVFTSTMKNPKLLDCTLESLLQSIMQCAQLGLEPILGRAYLIPYNNNKQVDGKWQKVLECQFQPGYQGLVDLARRSGQVKDVFAMVVYENDEFDLEYGTNRRLLHKPFLGKDPGEPLGAYTVWELSDGTKTFEFMPLHEIYKRRDKSQAFQYAIKNPKNKTAQECPWIQWPEEQMKKTVVKHHAKLQPASIEVMQAAELDEAADIGRSQLGMFTDSPVYGGLPAPESEPKTYDTSKFDKLASKYLDLPDSKLDKFLDLTAQAQAITVDKLKVAATESPENSEEFFQAFKQWRLDNYPTTEERVDCPWPDCDYRPKKGKGYKRHLTNAHDGKEPGPTPPEELKPIIHADKVCPECGEPCWGYEGKPIFCKACSWEEPPPAIEPPEKTQKTSGNNSNHIRCPVKNRGIAVENCTACEINKKCQTYAEYLHDHKEDKL